VHDTLLVDGPSEKVELMQEVIQRHMLESADELVDGYVPFKVDFKVGKNWGFTDAKG
jgi:DNA polymerase I-like protein with 3'-5' exonuclease and polymerase domains